MSSFLALIITSVLFFGPIVLVIKFLSDLDEMGKPDRDWNPVRIGPREGELEFYAKGSVKGPKAKVLASVPGWRYNPTKDLMIRRKEPETLESVILGFFGARWVGFFRKRMHFVLKWNDYAKPEGQTEYQIVAREEKDATRFYFQTVMGVETDDAKTSENFPIDSIMVLTLRIVKPVKVAFFAGDLFTQVTAAVQGIVRSYTGNHSFVALREQKKENGLKDLIQCIYALNDKDEETGEEGLREKFGLEVHDVRFPQFDIHAGSKEVTAATEAVGIANLQADALRAKADGEHDAEVKLADAKAKAINKVSQAEARSIKRRYKAVMSVPEGSNIFKWESVRGSQLRALADVDSSRSGHQVLTEDVTKGA